MTKDLQNTFKTSIDSNPSILILGAGGSMGKAAVKFALEKGINVIAADLDENSLRDVLCQEGLKSEIETSRIKLIEADASNFDDLKDTIEFESPDMCASFLPVGTLAFNTSIASALAGVNYVSSNFLNKDAHAALDEQTKALNIDSNRPIETFEELLDHQGVSSEWGRGLDPGLDSWAYSRALESFKGGSLTSIKSVGAGISEKPEDMYVYTWHGVTNGMGHRHAMYIKNGKVQKVSGKDKFAPENRKGFETITLTDGTIIETYLNNDEVDDLKEQANALGIETDNLEFSAFLTGRHEGHCDFWRPLVQDLDLLNNQYTYAHPTSMNEIIKDLFERRTLDGKDMSAVKKIWPQLEENGFLSEEKIGTGTAKEITEKHLSKLYAPKEGKADRSIIYIELSGTNAAGQHITRKIELDCLGDPSLEGHTSMQKTVAGTLIRSAAQTIEKGNNPGLRRPRHDLEKGKAVLDQLETESVLKIHDQTINTPAPTTEFDL